MLDYENRHSAPIIYVEEDRLLYIGKMPSDSLLYTNNVCLYGMSLNKKIKIHHQKEVLECESFFISPGALHKVEYSKDDIVVWMMLEPTHVDCEILKRKMKHAEGLISFGMRDAEELKSIFLSIYNNKPSVHSVKQMLSGQLGFLASDHYGNAVKDMRILKSMDSINNKLAENIPVEELAREAGLSNGRLQQLFKQQAQMSLRQYRLWRRLKMACELYANKKTFSEIAVDTGFSDASHLSRAFQNAFGKPASLLLGASSGVSFIV